MGDQGCDARRQPRVTAPHFPAICLVSPLDRRAEVSPGQTCPLGAREEAGNEEEPCPVSSVLLEASWGWGPRRGFACRSGSPQRGRWLLGRVPSRPAAVRCHSAATSPPDRGSAMGVQPDSASEHGAGASRARIGGDAPLTWVLNPPLSPRSAAPVRAPKQRAAVPVGCGRDSQHPRRPAIPPPSSSRCSNVLSYQPYF